jgi:hypothetical protein
VVFQLYLVENFRHSFAMERYARPPVFLYIGALLILSAIYTIPKLCKQKPLLLPIVYGSGIGKGKAENIRQVLLCGR